MSLKEIAPANAADEDGTVTLDTSDGKTLGFAFMENKVTGKGAAIKAIDAGGQAEASGKFTVGQLITHINGTDVTEMTIKEIAPITKSPTTIEFTLADAPLAAEEEGDDPRQWQSPPCHDTR